MITVDFIEKNKELYIKNLINRGYSQQNAVSLISKILNSSKHRKSAISSIDAKNNLRATISKEIAQAMQAGDLNVVELKKYDALANKQEITSLENDLQRAQNSLNELLKYIPNMLEEGVPVGKSEADNVEVGRVNCNSLSAGKDHVMILNNMGLQDIERAAKISGSGYSVLYGDIVALEFALESLFMKHSMLNGYSPISVPFIVNAKSMHGTGQLPKFEDDLFQIDGGDYLIPTAEVPLTNLYRDEMLELNKLPIRMSARTPCFRAEAGGYGAADKGLIRQHQFIKNEIVTIVDEKNAAEEFLNTQKVVSSLIQHLNLPFRKMLLCSKDTSFSAAICYDYEVWLPGSNNFREISSVSYFRDFQGTRMNSRYKENNKSKFVHTINGSALPVGRTIVAILENNYDEKNNIVKVPKVLQDYIGLDHIRARK